MNCKQGDLAYVAKRIFHDNDDLVGKIVKCHALIHIGPYPCWLVDPFEYRGHVVGAINDLVLKPIRGEPIPDEVTDTKIVDKESMTIPA